MKLRFHGAARTVTGSQHLLEVNGHRLLLDCGLFQGRRKEAFELNRQGHAAPPESIHAVVLSHAHIDHSGNLPSLVKGGFRGDVWATGATRDLCALLLMDSAHIQQHDVRFVNKRRAAAGKRLFEPLYGEADVKETLRLFNAMPYGRSKEILPGVRLRFNDAGHMLGSAHVILDIEDRDDGRSKRLVFSGDVGRANNPIIRDPEPVVEGCDILLIESTYAGRSHPPYPESEAILERVVNETAARGGVLLIPAFAVGRTQQIVYALHRLHGEGRIPTMPVYVDSPLAVSATEVFRLHPETYDEETLELMEDSDSPFRFQALQYVRSVTESKLVNQRSGPAVIISASGMMENGRILHHLANRVSDPRNTILVSGWQAPHTLGRRIVEGEKEVRIFGVEMPMRAQVEIVTGFSGHADQAELDAWVDAMEKKPALACVIHGEEESVDLQAKHLRQRFGIARVVAPKPGDEVTC